MSLSTQSSALSPSGSCPTGCGRSVQLGMLMCRPCWHLVPPDLQRPVWVAWRALNRAQRSAWNHDAIRTLRREHAEAKEKAIDNVKARITQKELFA